MSFGFSAGDFLALSQLIFKASKALNDSYGSKAEYKGLIQTLLSLLRSINTAEEFALRCSLDFKASRDASVIAPLNAIAREREICQKLIEEFLLKSEKYTASFIHGAGRAKAIKKLTWRLFHADDVQNLERELRVHVDAIQFYTCNLGFQSLNASLAESFGVITQIDNRTTMIYEMINQLVNIMPRALGYTWEGGYAPDEKPLRLLDALGRDLKIPAMFLASHDVFHDTLEIVHRNLPGHRKIKLKEYSIADEDSEGQAIDAEANLQWSKTVRPGRTVSLNMVFQTFSHNKSSEKCPRCRSVTTGPVLNANRRRCQFCQLTFHIFEKVRVEEVKQSSGRLLPASVMVVSADRKQVPEKPRQNKRQPKPIAKDRKGQEQDIFRRIHYIHELVERRTAGVATQKSQCASEDDKYMKDLPILHQAAALGDLKTVERLLDDAEIDIDSKGGCEDATALHYAAYQGHQNVAIFLIEHGARLESRDCDGASPLHWSIFSDTPRFSNYSLSAAPKSPLGQPYILEESGDVDPLDDFGLTPLYHCDGDCSEVIRFLVDEGAAINAESRDLWRPLHTIVMNCSTNAINTFLQYGVDIDAVNNLGSTALYKAAGRKEHALEVCELLINHGASVDRIGDSTQIPLHKAVRNPSVLEMLLTRGASVDARDMDGRTPLQRSIELGEYDSFNHLLAFEANIDAKDNEDDTALHYAASLDSPQFTRQLLEAGAEVSENMKLETPLHLIGIGTPKDTVTLLVDHGADVNAVDNTGCFPLMNAAGVGNNVCVKALLELGADPHMKIHPEASAPGTSLARAIDKGHLAVVQTLLDAGASIGDPIESDDISITLLHLAVYLDHGNIVALLLDSGADPLASGGRLGIPLQLAALADVIESAQVLLTHYSAGEQLAYKGCQYRTPLELATRRGHFNLVKMLMEHPANKDPISISDVLEYASKNDRFQEDIKQWYHERHE